jgi:hypothetical protein
VPNSWEPRFDVVNEQDLSGLNFFVTSRSEPTLIKQITDFPSKQVCRLEEVSLEESSADIKVFLSTHLARCATTLRIQQLASAMVLGISLGHLIRILSM